MHISHSALPAGEGRRLLTRRIVRAERVEAVPRVDDVVHVHAGAELDGARQAVGELLLLGHRGDAETWPVVGAAAGGDVWSPEVLQTGHGAVGCRVDVVLDCRVVSCGHGGLVGWLATGGACGGWCLILGGGMRGGVVNYREKAGRGE